jgi:protein-tyrosine phosphatase
MRFGVFQIVLGALLIACGPVFGGVAWALLWPGLSVAIVGAGYLGLGPRVFGKRASDGALSWLILIAMLPYFFVAWSLWQLKSRLRSEAPWHEVAPGIYLGRRPLNGRELPDRARIVVDLTSEFRRAPSTSGADRYFCVPVLDTSAPDDESFARLIAAIETEAAPIFVHCAMGHGRSATVAAALLVRRGIARDASEAIARLKAHRPGVYLHPIQRAAVERICAREPIRFCATLPGDDPAEDRPDRAPGAA